MKSPEKRAALIKACLSQNAARSAAEILVFATDRSKWRLSQQAILEDAGPHARKEILAYYGKLVPLTYGWFWLAPLKWLLFNTIGIFRPIMRGPCSARDIDEVCIKSAALAAQNFMMAISVQGFDTCPMEGLDETRVSKILGLDRRARVVMAISVGMRDEKGIWGERFRLPREMVFKEI